MNTEHDGVRMCLDQYTRRRDTRTRWICGEILIGDQFGAFNGIGDDLQVILVDIDGIQEHVDNFPTVFGVIAIEAGKTGQEETDAVGVYHLGF